MTLTRDYSCVPRGEEEVLGSIKVVDVVMMEQSFAIRLDYFPNCYGNTKILILYEHLGL